MISNNVLRGLVAAVLGGVTFAAGAAGGRIDAIAVGGEPAQLASAPPGQLQVQPSAWFVEFQGAPAAVVYAEEIERSGRQLGLATATRAARERIAASDRIQSAFLSELSRSNTDHQVLYRVTRVANGIALQAPDASLEQIRKQPGVRRVVPMYPEYPSNSSSVPFIGAPGVWDNVLSTLPRPTTGQGISIGVIDTGIDYQHGHFGGTGALADYQANDRTVITDLIGGQPSFPTAKVVGGWDFAGDAYTGSNAATPDPDPMDCNGHGSHVAGTAAGLGVNADGTPFAGPWDSAQNYGALRIGPGVAPGADLYALRVFGCTGSTNLTVQAIEWAMDPNDDGDFSDHLDVINMSLGSNFGDRYSVSAVASDNAARAGVVVVTSAGNAGDSFFITGAPGSATRALSTANTVDAGVSAGAMRVNAPGPLANFYLGGAPNWPTGPLSDTTADVVLVDDGVAAASINDGCETPFVNAAAVAGRIAFIDRGTCAFELKVKNAQDNGAIGVIIGYIAAGAVTGMADDPVVTGVNIPSVAISFADATAIKAQLAAPVNATLWASGADTVNSSSSRGPRRASPVMALKPDIAAPGSNIISAQTGITGAATFAAGNLPLSLSGTSMASPHMAGVMALLRDLYPGYSVEELKALAMSRAPNDLTTFPGGAGARMAASRVGGGRIETLDAAEGGVVAFNAEDAGQVSVSFESAVAGSVTRNRTLRLVNHTAAAETYDIAIDTVVDAAGVSFSLPGGSSVSVPANGGTTFDVQMSADASLMDHSRDPAITATQSPSAGTVSANFAPAQPRHYLAEESAYVTFSQGGVPMFRVPVYVAAYPVADMTAAPVIATGGNPTGSTTVALSGTPVCTGGGTGGCSPASAQDQLSLVSAFELQANSPRDATIDPALDLRHVGIGYVPGSDAISFGIATWGPWSSPSDVSFRVDIDCGVYTLVGSAISTDTCTGAPDGVYDLRLVSVNRGTLNQLFTGSTTAGIDVYQTFVIGLQPGRTGSALVNTSWVNGLTADIINTRLLHNEVQFLLGPRASLKITDAFRYRVSTCYGLTPTCSGAGEYDSTAQLSWNRTTPGLDFGNGGILADDVPGNALPVTWNTANLAANGSLGALLLHHHNAEGKRAQVVLLDGTANVDLAAAIAVNDPTPDLGGTVQVTFTVQNTTASAATGVSAAIDLPFGVSYLSDNGGGAYDDGNGIWTVGNLAASASASLTVTLQVDESGPQQITGRITGATPIDAQTANDQASVWINAPFTADIAVAVAAAASSVEAGDPIEVTVTVSNDGPDQAFNLSIEEAFAGTDLDGIEPVSSSASQGAYDAATGTWTIPSLAPAASATLELTFTAPSSFTDIVTSFDASATSESADPNTGNNDADVEITIARAPNADLQLAVDAPATSGCGAPFTVTFEVINDGPDTASDTEFTAVLPAGVTFDAITASSGTCGTPDVDGEVTCTSGTLDPGHSLSIELALTPTAASCDASVQIDATVSSSTPDAVPANNAASATIGFGDALFSDGFED